MLNTIINTISNTFNNQKKHFLVAVSGGIDSMVLLHLLKESGQEITVAHVNYQLRGEDSDLDEQFVIETCKQYNVPIHTIKFNTKEKIESNEGSLQMIARELRYDWFKKLTIRLKTDCTVTAHHLDDQIETILLNLTRGTGIKGLTGMDIYNNGIYRPLLSISKNQIIAYAKQHNIQYRHDKSNSSNVYKRNKIRNEVIPLLQELNPSLTDTFLKNIEIFNKTADIYHDKIKQELSNKLIKTKGDRFFISISKLTALKHGDAYLFDFLHSFGFNYDQVNKAYNLILTDLNSGKQFKSFSHNLLIDRDELILYPIQKHDDQVIEIKKTTKNVTNPIQLTLDIKPIVNIKLTSNPLIAYLDLEKLSFPLCLRKWKQGDVFTPIGMTGKKKLSDFFIDLKVSRATKEETYVITSKNEIVWVVGYRISDKFKLSSKTSRALLITLKPY